MHLYGRGVRGREVGVGVLSTDQTTSQKHTEWVSAWRQTFIHKTAESVGERLSNESKDRLSTHSTFTSVMWLHLNHKETKGFLKAPTKKNRQSRTEQHENNIKMQRSFVALHRAVIQRSTQTDATFDRVAHFVCLLWVCVTPSVCFGLLCQRRSWRGPQRDELWEANRKDERTGRRAESKNSSRSKRLFQRDPLLLTVH